MSTNAATPAVTNYIWRVYFDNQAVEVHAPTQIQALLIGAELLNRVSTSLRAVRVGEW